MGRPAMVLAALFVLSGAAMVTCRSSNVADQLRSKQMKLLDDGGQQSILQTRVAAVAVHNLVILTQTSCGYLEFAINWILHVEALGVTNWLTIAEDQESLKYLNER